MVADGMRRYRTARELRATFRGYRDGQLEPLGKVRTRHFSSTSVREPEVIVAHVADSALPATDQPRG